MIVTPVFEGRGGVTSFTASKEDTFLSLGGKAPYAQKVYIWQFQIEIHILQSSFAAELLHLLPIIFTYC